MAYYFKHTLSSLLQTFVPRAIYTDDLQKKERILTLILSKKLFTVKVQYPVETRYKYVLQRLIFRTM